VFFDDEKTSETYAEQLTHCPACGRSLERKGLRDTTPSFTSLG
jgi:C4-type Zn-finger protein